MIEMTIDAYIFKNYKFSHAVALPDDASDDELLGALDADRDAKLKFLGSLEGLDVFCINGLQATRLMIGQKDESGTKRTGCVLPIPKAETLVMAVGPFGLFGGLTSLQFKLKLMTSWKPLR